MRERLALRRGSADRRSAVPPGVRRACRQRVLGILVRWAVRETNEPWASCVTDANLSTPPTPGEPGNCPPSSDLDLHVGWDRFERLILDLVQRFLGLRGVRFRRYGTPGQKQHGIDLAGRDPEGVFVVVQCKDYRSFTKADLRKAVAKFTSGRRTFDAIRLIVVTSANTEATQVFDDLAALQSKHPELTLDLWGAEQINDCLRRAWMRHTWEISWIGLAHADPDLPPAPQIVLPGAPSPPRARYVQQLQSTHRAPNRPQ
jgi:Restriction endonuclease